MTLRSRVSALTLAILASLAATSARAVDLTFDMTQIAFGNNSSSLTVSGYTLLFTATNGNLGGSVDATTGGLAADTFSSFTVQKTAGPSDLIFKSYGLGNFNNLTAGTKTFNLTGGTGTSTGNSFAQTTTFNYNGSYILAGSQTVTYSLVNFGSIGIVPDAAFFNTLTFTPVPEPSTYALGTIAAAVVGLTARRRNKASRAL